jgi:hypothetical protein
VGWLNYEQQRSTGPRYYGQRQGEQAKTFKKKIKKDF